MPAYAFSPGLRSVATHKTCLLVRAYCTRGSSPNTVLCIPTANVYRFGDANNARPVFRDLQWTIKDGESWAVVGSGSGEKAALFQMLLGHLRISPAPPPPDGLFPFLSKPSFGLSRDPFDCLSFVSFGNRRRAAGGAFYDYTARYGAVREEDRITLRQSMFPETQPQEFNTGPPKEIVPFSQKDQEIFEFLVDKLELGELLDLPLVALSNGQTRRARIIKAIISKPELLLLDEPLTGLDVQSRPTLLEVLYSLHTATNPRVIIGLRTQDPIPDWITHVAFVKGGTVITGPKKEVLSTAKTPDVGESKMSTSKPSAAPTPQGKLLVEMKNVNVKYGPRTVLKDLNWEVRQGERWHLQGTNGSGKTTLLSLLTGDHPQSYTQQHLHLHSLPRRRIATPHLHSLIGLLSPELFDAFPRRAGMTVWEAVGTGFDGGFVPLGKEGVGIGVLQPLDDAGVRWRIERCWEVLNALGPRAWTAPGAGTAMNTEEFKNKRFVDLAVGEQRMVLMMRALVGRPPLVLLDEVWSGMDESMVGAARLYLREGGGVTEEQAVVVVTHWEDEVPWGVEDGVRRFKLDGGMGSVVDV